MRTAPVGDWTLVALLVALMQARPGISPAELVDFARMLARGFPAGGGRRRVARILSMALAKPSGCGVSDALLVNRFILSWHFERLLEPEREALTDWQFGRRRSGTPHPWILAERTRCRALAAGWGAAT